ncbi:hypothetical protein VTH8203_03019 [Vibrio thalassae]|uniref:Uncharacterized protein n=1 Tax=Vibrio thalassae TaxID=1243014 RepID=A0A240EKZ1_9VIBR|nr:hypothetical protein VTH8203_03019 [Vibrio thalassae]
MRNILTVGYVSTKSVYFSVDFTTNIMISEIFISDINES